MQFANYFRHSIENRSNNNHNNNNNNNNKLNACITPRITIYKSIFFLQCIFLCLIEQVDYYEPIGNVSRSWFGYH